MTLSQNEKVRAAIEGALDAGHDLTMRSERTAMINDYIKANKDASPGSIRSAFSKQIPGVVKERGLDPSKVKAAKHVKAKYDKGLNMQIDPKPADVAQGGEQTQKAQVGAPGQQVPAAPIVYTAEGVGEMWGGLIETVRLKVPEIKSLDAGQKNALGGLWMPVANRYLATHERAAILFMCLTTAGIIGGHIVEGVRAHRAANDKKKEYQDAREAAEREGSGHREAAQPAPEPADKPVPKITGDPKNVAALSPEV